MSVDVQALGPGDVIVLSEGGKLVRRWIERGARLRGHPDDVNHVIVVHHHDPRPDPGGRWWGLEGRPGGVGWRDLTDVLKRPDVVANTEQRKTQTQRFYVAKASETLLRAAYDWPAIVHDARMAARMDHLFRAKDWDDTVEPLAFVCSSYADYLYEHPLVRLASPNGDVGTRFTTPGEWKRFIVDREWES